MAWNYNPAEYEEQDFAIIPVGDHRMRIADVVEKTFSSGNDGYEITLDVSGHASKLWHYLVLDKADTKKTNPRIGAFFDSFGITDYDMTHYKGWVGKVGAARVRHEEYNGEQRAKVAFLLSRSKQDKLPPAKFNGAVAPVANVGVTITDEDLPF